MAWSRRRLRDGEVEVDVRLEVDLLDRQTIEGLRSMFLMPLTLALMNIGCRC